jgi:hypothetical protein
MAATTSLDSRETRRLYAGLHRGTTTLEHPLTPRTVSIMPKIVLMRLADPRSSSWKSCPRLGRKGGGTDQGGTHRVESGRSDVSAWAVRRTAGISFGARLRGFRNGRRGGSGRDRVETGRSGQSKVLEQDHRAIKRLRLKLTPFE